MTLPLDSTRCLIMNTWRALFVSTESAKAHLWKPRPHSSWPDAMHSWCGRVRVVSMIALEPERADRRRCELCERMLKKMQEAK